MSRFKNRKETVVSWKEMGRKINSIIPYPGGKAGLVSRLVPLLEWTAKQYQLSGFAEVTGGGGRCLLNLDSKLFKQRIYSDVDLPLCCLFQVLTNEKRTNSLVNKLFRQSYTKENFQSAVSTRKRDNLLAREGRIDEASDIVTSAANTFVAACQSYAAKLTSFEGKSVRKQHQAYYKRVLNLNHFNSILSGVEVIRWDCRKIIEEIENGEHRYPATQFLVYVDPPYDPEAMMSDDHYEYTWNKEDHVDFRDLIKNTEIYMVISGYSSPIYDVLEDKYGWKKIFLKNKHVGMSGTSRRKEEFIYINFEICPELMELISDN